MSGDLVDPGLIESIYQSALTPASWPRTLDELVASFRAMHAFVFTNKDTRASYPFVATTGLDDGDLARYFSPDGIRLWAP